MSGDDTIDLAARRKAREVLACMAAAELDERPFIQNRFTVHTALANELRLQVGPGAVPHKRAQWPLSVLEQLRAVAGTTAGGRPVGHVFGVFR